MSSNDALKVSDEEFRRVGYRVIDLIADHLESDAPLSPGHRRFELDSSFAEPAPRSGSSPDHVLNRLVRDAFPANVAADHRRFFAFVPGPSNGIAALADALAVGFNLFGGTWLTGASATEIELVTLEWLRDLLGFPEPASGVFVPGGSVANLTGLGIARDRCTDWRNGFVFGSDQTHSSVWKACHILGIPTDHCVQIATDADMRVDIDELRGALQRTVTASSPAIAIVGNAGTTNSAAVDDLVGLRTIADEFGTWLHVDGSYGAAAVLDPASAAKLRGLGEVDSLSIDPHKWWFQPYECSVLLTRDPHLMEETYSVRPEYLRAIDEMAGEPNLCDRGIQLSRGAAAVRLWMTIETFGLDAMGAAVRHGIELAEHAQRCLNRRPGWNVVTPAHLGVITFDHVGGAQVATDAVAALNQSGLGFLACTTLKGRLVVRMCTINPRTTLQDVEDVIDALDHHATHSPASKLAG